MRTPFLKLIVFAVFSLLVGLIAVPGSAQDVEPYGAQPAGVHIVWPLPISELWETIAVIGTADVTGMQYYYFEYLPLNSDYSQPVSAPWYPAGPIYTTPVRNGLLALLNTNRVTDGLYALRLVVTTDNGQRYTDTIAPLRVNNARYHSETERIVRLALIAAGIQPTPIPPAPAPTPDPNGPPMVTPSGAAVNVRRCDVVDNYSCAVLGYLYPTQMAPVFGISSTGSGWYYVQTPSGVVGWVSPTVVTTVGNFSAVPYMTPPEPLPPLPPPQPQPPVSNPVPPQPPSGYASILLNGISINGTPTCGVDFNVNVNVANVGSAPSGNGTVTLQDVNLRTGEVTATSYGGYPSINPGGDYVVVINMFTTAYYNEAHELRAYTGNQAISTQYTLAQGNCNAQSQPEPPPTSPTTIMINQSADGGTVDMNVRDALILNLPAEPGSGTGWFLTTTNFNALDYMTGPTTMSDGSMEYTFAAVQPGTDLLQLVYQRGNEPPFDTFSVTVNVH